MDPTGHVHGLKELAENAREGGIYNVGIVVQNMKEAERFYGAVLGFEIFSRDYYPPVIPMRDASERVPFILSERGAGKAPYESGVTAFAGLAIEVADIDAEIERLRPLGVKMLDPEPRLTANVLHMTIADPFGNLHEIIQHLDPAELEARMARQSPTTGTPAIADLAWLSGQWRLERGTDDASETLEETWSPATGDAMTGMFRWMRGDNVWLYELMSIEQTGDELTFHLRHFGRGLRVWDSEFEKLTPFAYPLKTANTNRLVFENPDRDQPRTIVYTRDSDTLTVELLGPDGTGMSFTFNRVQSDR
jgi:catechol 2,3-dioxygenase-like lactoylglutathione lyase family enzyme